MIELFRLENRPWCDFHDNKLRHQWHHINTNIIAGSVAGTGDLSEDINGEIGCSNRKV